LGQISLLISPADFEAFWEAYPRKVGKGAARKAYGQAVKKTPPASILTALAGFDWSPDPKFIPYPATWLNQERWLDVKEVRTDAQSRESEQKLNSAAFMVRRKIHAAWLSDHHVRDCLQAGLVTEAEAKAWGLNLR